MNYEILTLRWRCPECEGPIRLHFSQGADEGNNPSDEYVLTHVFCGMGHLVPDEMVEEIRPEADQEFAAAMEGGSKITEVWTLPPDEDPTTPNENVPPED